MNLKSFYILFKVVLIQTILAQIQGNKYESVSSSSALTNFDNLQGVINFPGSSNLPAANNLPTFNNLPVTINPAAPNTLTILSSLPTDNNLPANRLHLGLPFTSNRFSKNNALLNNFNNVGQTSTDSQINNLIANTLPEANKFPVNNYLVSNSAITNNLFDKNIFPNSPILPVNSLPNNNVLQNNMPVANAFAVNNFLASSLPAVNKFPVKTYLANNFPAINKIPVNNYIGKDFLTVNSLSVSNNLPAAILTPINPSIYDSHLTNNFANTVFTSDNNNLTPASILQNGQHSINEIVNEQIVSNLGKNVPKFIENITPDGLIAKNSVPVVNNLLNDLIDTNAFTNRQSVSSVNNNVPSSNIQVLNGLPLSSKLPNQQAMPYKLNAPTLPLCKDIPVVKVPTGKFIFNNMANNMDSMNFPERTLIMDKSLQPVNKFRQYSSVPNINYVQDNPRNILNNNGQSFLTILPATDESNAHIDKIHHCQIDAQTDVQSCLSNLPDYLEAEVTQTNNLLPCHRINNNCPNVNLPEIIIPGCNLPTSDVVNSLPFVNNLNLPSYNIFGLGDLNSLPLMNGLPVIGVTETVVINTAPSLYL